MSGRPAVTVIGCDGRAPSPRGAAALAAATLVLGARRHLDAAGVRGGEELVDVAAAVRRVAAHPGPAVVLASGDPGFFGIVRLLRAAGVDCEVLPAVSSVAAAFAAAGLSWDDATVVSAHGRELARAANVCRALPKVAVLTGPGAGPAELGAALAGEPVELVVAEALGSPAERVVRCTPAAAAGGRWAEPNVVLVLAADCSAREEGAPGWCAPPRRVPPRWALAEECFEHRDGMVTKAEVRAVALAHLGPGPGDLVWDVGAGSGSVAVECARFGAAAVAVDRDPDAAGRAGANAAAAGVRVRVVHGEAPSCLAALADPDAVFVGGGGPPVVAAAAARAARAVVVALAAVDRVAPCRAKLAAAGYAVGGSMLAPARLAELPDGASRLAAANPVFLLWGHR